MSTTVLGFKISMPIMVAPTAFQKMAHPEGNITVPDDLFLDCTVWFDIILSWYFDMYDTIMDRVLQLNKLGYANYLHA